MGLKALVVLLGSQIYLDPSKYIACSVTVHARGRARIAVPEYEGHLRTEITYLEICDPYVLVQRFQLHNYCAQNSEPLLFKAVQ
jgi:hypothetical protein